MQHFNNTHEQEIYDCIKAVQESVYKAIELQVKSHEEAIISTIEKPLAERIETFLRQLEEKNETLHLSGEYFNIYEDLWHSTISPNQDEPS